jgi:N-acetylmuramoyl-L-alanine amidase
MKICIDAGHGENDPGAVNDETKEKDINLSASFMLAALLSKDHEIHLLRVSDENMSLTTRTDEANDGESELFISIHCNSFSNAEVRGFEIHHYPSSSKGKKIAEHIVDKMKEEHATAIHGDGVFASNFHVLRKTTMPAILIELGFLSHVQDKLNLVHSISLFKLMIAIANILDDKHAKGVIENG